KYYSSTDNVLDPGIRANFLIGLESFLDEAFGDRISTISLSDFKFIVYFKKIQVPDKDTNDTELLVTFAIIEQETDPNFVKKHLKEILREFRNKYSLSDILSKSPIHFQNFKKRINEILGDLRLKIDDRLRSLFRD
ncbi:MAG: hypothetical protein ACXAAH_16970, partial [Promethearchaeota archaeon]